MGLRFNSEMKNESALLSVKLVQNQLSYSSTCLTNRAVNRIHEIMSTNVKKDFSQFLTKLGGTLTIWGPCSEMQSPRIRLMIKNYFIMIAYSIVTNDNFPFFDAARQTLQVGSKDLKISWEAST